MKVGDMSFGKSKIHFLRYPQADLCWVNKMNEYVHKLGRIVDIYNGDVIIDFGDNTWFYPLVLFEVDNNYEEILINGKSYMIDPNIYDRFDESEIIDEISYIIAENEGLMRCSKV